MKYYILRKKDLLFVSKELDKVVTVSSMMPTELLTLVKYEKVITSTGWIVEVAYGL